jgi:hypothetical protein
MASEKDGSNPTKGAKKPWNKSGAINLDGVDRSGSKVRITKPADPEKLRKYREEKARILKGRRNHA